MIKLLENCSGNREKWLEMRKGTIGGSEIATILGLNPYSTPLQLWLEKTGKEDRGSFENDAMWLGTQLEPVVAQLYQRKTGKVIKRADFLAIKKGAEFASATPDYVTEDESAPIEIKTCGVKSMYKWEDSVPDVAHAQLMWQLGVCDWPAGTVACLPANSPEKFIYKEFPYDPNLFDFMLEKAAAFMQMVKSDTPPPARAQDADILAARALQKRAKGEDLPLKELPLTDSLLGLMCEYDGATTALSNYKKSVKLTEERLEVCRVELLQLIGDAGGIKVGEWEVRIKKQERKGYVVKDSSWLSWSTKILDKAM